MNHSPRATSIAPTLPRHYPWLVVAMLWAISLFNYADRQAIFSVFPLLQRQLGLSTVQLGLLASGFAWVYGLGGQFAGILVDRLSRRKIILAGLYAWSVICSATGLFRGFRALFLLRAAEGLGEMFYYPAAMSILSDYHGPRTRSRALGIHQTSVYAGTIAGGFFAGLIGEVYGWRWTFVVFGVLGIALGLLLQRHLREPVRGAADAALGAPIPPVRVPVRSLVAMIWRRPAVLLLMSAFVCANFVALVLLSWMPAYVYQRFHMSLAMAGLAATVFAQTASIAGSVLGGWLADAARRATPGGRALVQAFGTLLGAPCVALCGLTSSFAWFVAALTAWGLFKGIYDANIYASVFDVVPVEARGSAAGFMNTVGWLGGGGAAPLAVGLIARSYGLGVGIALASAVYLAAAVFLLAAARLIIIRAQPPDSPMETPA